MEHRPVHNTSFEIFLNNIEVKKLNSLCHDCQSTHITSALCGNLTTTNCNMLYYLTEQHNIIKRERTQGLHMYLFFRKKREIYGFSSLTRIT